MPEAQYISCTVLDDEPKLSELAQGKYDAIIEYKDGAFEISSIKGEDFEKSLNEVLNNGKSINEAFSSKQNRGVISNLVGFLCMLLIMMGSILYKFYYSDKGGIARRIVVSKLGYVRYILCYPFSVFLVLFVPAWFITIISSSTLNLSNPYQIPEMTFMMFVLCLLGASYNFLVAAFSKNEQSGGLFATMSIVLTSLLSGSFTEIAKGGMAERMSYLFPQRYIVDFAINLENENELEFISMFVVIGISILFVILAGIKTVRDITKE